MKLFYKICLFAGGAMLMLGIIIGGAGLVLAEATGALNRGEEYVTFFSIEVGTEATTALLEDGELMIGPGDAVSVYQFGEEEIRALDVEVGIAEVFIMPDSSFSVEASNCIPENFSCEVKDGVLTVRDTTDEDDWNYWVDNVLSGSWDGGIPVITIHISEFRADSVSLSTSAGNIYVETPLYTEDAELSAGLGSIYIDWLEVYGRSSYDIGAGELTINQLNAGNITVECGIGNAYISGDIGGNCRLECGVGSVYLETSQPYQNFNYKVECGIGSVMINDRDYDGIAKSVTIDNGADAEFRIECGIGDVQVVTG